MWILKVAIVNLIGALLLDIKSLGLVRNLLKGYYEKATTMAPKSIEKRDSIQIVWVNIDHVSGTEREISMTDDLKFAKLIHGR